MTDEFIIFLDMDGVICNFIDGVAGLYDMTESDILLKLEHSYLLSKALGVSSDQLWNTIEQQGSSFWTHLPTYSWTKNLYQNLKLMGEVYICTSPSLDPESASGKLHWLQARLNPYLRNFIITPNKHLLAGNDRILIDDNIDNINKFKKYGGHGILFPQPYNGLKIDSKTDYIINEIKTLKQT